MKSQTLQFNGTEFYFFAVSVISDLNGYSQNFKSSGNLMDDTNLTYSVSICQINGDKSRVELLNLL